MTGNGIPIPEQRLRNLERTCSLHEKEGRDMGIRRELLDEIRRLGKENEWLRRKLSENGM